MAGEGEAVKTKGTDRAKPWGRSAFEAFWKPEEGSYVGAYGAKEGEWLEWKGEPNNHRQLSQEIFL